MALKQNAINTYLYLVGDPNSNDFLSTNTNHILRFLLNYEYDPYYLYLGAYTSYCGYF
jgi:hypothetical protein